MTSSLRNRSQDPSVPAELRPVCNSTRKQEQIVHREYRIQCIAASTAAMLPRASRPAVASTGVTRSSMCEAWLRRNEQRELEKSGFLGWVASQETSWYSWSFGGLPSIVVGLLPFLDLGNPYSVSGSLQVSWANRTPECVRVW